MFGLDDLVPTTLGVGQGALDIIGNQNKAAMDALALENALMKAHADQQRTTLNDQYMPILLAAQNREALQKMNVMPGQEGVDPSNPLDFFASTPIVSDTQTKIAEQEAQMKVAMEKVKFTEGNKVALGNNKEANDLQIANNKAAEDKSKELVMKISPTGRVPANPSQNKIDQIRSAYLALGAYGKTPALISFYRTYEKFLRDAPNPGQQSAPEPIVEAPKAGVFGEDPAAVADLVTPPAGPVGDDWMTQVTKNRGPTPPPKKDPQVADYAAKYNLSYEQANAIIEKRKSGK